jgi:hypothetical protein
MVGARIGSGDGLSNGASRYASSDGASSGVEGDGSDSRDRSRC